MIEAITENGASYHYQYDHHLLTRYTDLTGRGMNLEYDGIEPISKAYHEWADDGSFHTRLKWHDRIRQVAVYNADDVPTYYYFDQDGFTYRTRLADGREEWYSRDKNKRITRHIDFFGLETQQEYNQAGQLSKVVQPNGGVIRFAYDDQGQLLETKDPEGNIWKQEYDAKGQVIKQIDPLNRITQFKYNADGQVVEVKDAKESGDPNWSRYADFMKRHTANCGHLPPTYYRAYGYYYCSRFGAYLLPTMKNQEGKRWLKEARRYLQVYMDNGLDQNNKGTEFFLLSKFNEKANQKMSFT